ncbi:MAG: hypothetical protein FH753_17990 [Firmicutes bacterium]|nr:hypothetical protein [Bacillota bacterium]
MRVKRILVSLLVFSMIMSIGVSSALADGNGWTPPGLRKKGGMPPGLAKKLFKDVDDLPWAVKAIEDMKLKGLIKGEGNGRFVPRDEVTKLETIAMALRVMGWEEESTFIDHLPDIYNGEDVPNWAKGYITLAYEKGILDDVDMMHFRPNSPAKRYEVAKIVIKALGYEEEAEDHMDEELPFDDSSLVPSGAIGYVYLINDLEIMTGDNQNRFDPMGTLTRAEMAVLFSRLDKKVDSEADKYEFTGKVYRVYEDYIKIILEKEIKKIDVDEDEVVVYEGNDRVYYEEIEKGDIVRVTIEEGKAAYIEILDEDYDEDKIIRKYTGEVINLDKNDEDSIAIEIKEMVLVFKVIDDIDVEFKNGEGHFDDINKGDEVTITVDSKNRAREIKVYRYRKSEDVEIEGEIEKLDLVGIYHITIDDEEYRLSKEADVEIDDRNKDLDDLEVGMEVKAELEDNIVVSIEAEEIEKDEVKGEIEKLDLVGVYHITIDDEEYRLSKEADVEIDDRNKDLDDLEVGMEVKAELEDNIVVSIEAEEIEKDEVKGEIEKLDLVGVYHITIDDEEYRLSKEADVEIDDRNKDLDDLEVGMEVKAELEDNIVVSLEVENVEFEIEGEIKEISEMESGIKITIDDDDHEYEYFLDEDVDIEEDGEDIDVDDLDIGDEGDFKVRNRRIIKIDIDD